MPLEFAPVITMPLVSPAAGSRRPKPETLADVAERIKDDQSLSPTRRRDMLSALATVARALGCDMKDVPAHAGFIRERLRTFEPSMMTPRVAVGRWRNVTSLANTAMLSTGVNMNTVRYRAPVAPCWKALLLKLDYHKRSGLSHLAQFCTAEGIMPEAVDDEVLTRFLAHLKRTLMTKSPRDTHRMACKFWNTAAQAVKGWPQRPLKVPDYRNLYAVPWEKFPPSLKADLDRHLAHLGAEDVLDHDGDFKPLKPLSIRNRAYTLHAFASALVHRGKDPQTLTSLADLVEVETFKIGLRFFLEQRTPGKHLRAYRVAVTLIPVAKHWVKVPPEHLKKLQEITRRLDTQPKGMTEKNRKMLAAFDDDAVVEKFLSLPTLLTTEVERAEEEIAKGKAPKRCRYSGRSLNTPSQRALFVQTAVAIEVLIMAPLRRANLGGIEIGVHLLPYQGGYRLQFEEREVKNEQRLAPALPTESAKLIRTYIQRHRQHLVKGASSFLFPGTQGSHKNFNALSQQIAAAAKVYAGITLTAHTFRHIAAKLHLRANPGDYGTVKVILGHKNIQTTIDAYCESEQPAAFERYDEHVLRLRGPNRDKQSGATKPTQKER